MSDTAFVTRFAPSPTGYLHLGHAFSALTAFNAARASDGRFLLRIEDIDAGRCRPEFEQAIFDDLAWLGLTWEEPVRRQSDHFADFAERLDRLDAMGLLYPCFCTRKDIAAEIARSANAPHGPDGPIYPGTCRQRSAEERALRIAAGNAFALRLDLEMALETAGDGLTWHDVDAGMMACDPRPLGDVVLARKDTPTSYHLSVTVDDALQGISHVIRGRDLFHATHVHRLLQALLDLPTPAYRHHALLTNAEGQRLSKRDRAQTLQELRAAGASADDVRRMAGLG